MSASDFPRFPRTADEWECTSDAWEEDPIRLSDLPWIALLSALGLVGVLAEGIGLVTLWHWIVG